jgi:5-deoxy-D-glucuronate isomerase
MEASPLAFIEQHTAVSDTILSKTEEVYYEELNIQKFLVLFEVFCQDTGLKKSITIFRLLLETNMIV